MYQNGIVDYVTELAGENPLTSVQFLESERRGRDRADKPEYKVKLSCAFCFSSAVSQIEYYHNSSWLEHGGAPDKACLLYTSNTARRRMCARPSPATPPENTA